MNRRSAMLTLNLAEESLRSVLLCIQAEQAKVEVWFDSERPSAEFAQALTNVGTMSLELERYVEDNF